MTCAWPWVPPGPPPYRELLPPWGTGEARRPSTEPSRELAFRSHTGREFLMVGVCVVVFTFKTLCCLRYPLISHMPSWGTEAKLLACSQCHSLMCTEPGQHESGARLPSWALCPARPCHHNAPWTDCEMPAGGLQNHGWAILWAPVGLHPAPSPSQRHWPARAF